MARPNERKLQETRILLHEGLERQHMRVEDIRWLQKVPQENPVKPCHRSKFKTTQRNLVATEHRNANRFVRDNCVRYFAEETFNVNIICCEVLSRSTSIYDASLRTCRWPRAASFSWISLYIKHFTAQNWISNVAKRFLSLFEVIFATEKYTQSWT